jgi:DNA modification methylase
MAMKPYYEHTGVTLHCGDCLEVMRGMPDCSVDAVICDPPYGLEFMGKEWDKLGTGDKRRIVVPEAAMGYQDGNGGNAHSRSAVRFTGGPTGARAMQDWHTEWAIAALRVLKPGGHLLAFGGTRTFHRLAVAIEDAGWEIRDTISWLYGQGFPKSLDVSKAIDRRGGNAQMAAEIGAA